MTTFGSVCSGIEAASVAWHPLGWKAAWLSEIEPFPCAVLAHHYPDVPNLGDMTKLVRKVLGGEIEAPDVFTGGTPCQAFSVAGKRQSLDDARGNLTLTFVEIADAIDHIRASRGIDPCVVVWENVPGVLSTKDNAFGCFLGALAGSGCELQPAGGRWTDAGCVYGPTRAVAWRVLDAQYFGLAQRRKRVFVVASARNGFDPGAVLFESDGVRRDSPPSREARQVAPTIPARSTAGGGLGTDFDCDGGVVQVCPTLRAGGNRTGGDRPPGTDVDTADSLVPVVTLCVATGQAGAEIGADMAPTLNCNHEAPYVAHSLRGEGFDASEDGTGRGTPLAPVIGWDSDLNTSVEQMGTLLRGGDGGRHEGVMVHLPFDTTQITSAANYSNPQPGDPCHPLAAGMHPPAIAFHHNAQACQLPGPDTGTGTGTGTSASLTCSQRAAVCYDSLKYKGVSHADAKKAGPCEALRRVRQIVGEEAFCLWSLGIIAALRPEKVLRIEVHGKELRSPSFSRNWLVHNALSRQEADPAWLLQSLCEAAGIGRPPQGWGLAEQFAGELGAYLSELPQPGAQESRVMRDLWASSEGAGLLRQALSAIQEMGRSVGGQNKSAPTTMQVRRLTCEEAEFLQGFSRGYTAIPWRKKPAEDCPDGPRYRALGNSWAVPCVAWIGRRIAAALQLRAAA